MPNTFLAPTEQGGAATKEGVILLGDAWNMRHPLTGGGMTCAFNDVVILRDLLLDDVRDLADWEQVRPVLKKWFWRRKPLSSTVNILSVALYDLFGADGTSSSPSLPTSSRTFAHSRASRDCRPAPRSPPHRLLQVLRARRQLRWRQVGWARAAQVLRGEKAA